MRSTLAPMLWVRNSLYLHAEDELLAVPADSCSLLTLGPWKAMENVGLGALSRECSAVPSTPHCPERIE